MEINSSELPMTIVTFEETGSNTGVFVSYDSSDNSKITINGDARSSTDFTIDYAGTDLDMIVEGL